MFDLAPRLSIESPRLYLSYDSRMTRAAMALIANIPPFRRVLHEARHLKQEIADGVRALHVPASLQGRRTAVQRVDPHHTVVWTQVPVVRDYITDTFNSFVKAIPITSEAERAERYAEARMFFDTAHSVSLWQHYGRRVYAIDPDLFTLLQQTDPPENVPVDALRFPLGAFYCYFAPRTLLLDIDGAKVDVEGLLVTVGDPSNEHEQERHLAVRCLVRVPRGHRDDEVAVASIADYEVTLTPGRLIGETARSLSLQERETWADPLEHALRMTFNLVLYLMTDYPALEAVPAPPVSTSRKAKKLRHLRGGTRALPVQYVGKPAPQDRAAAHADREARRAQTMRPVWVRGHFRHQPFGSGRQQFKVIWIRPYVKGTGDPSVGEARIARVWAARPK